MEPKYEQPENMATALDCAIRELEENNGNLGSGYQIPTNKPNYIFRYSSNFKCQRLIFSHLNNLLHNSPLK